MTFPLRPYRSAPSPTPYLWPLLLLLLLGGILLWRFWPASLRDLGRDAAAQPRKVTPRGELAEDEKSIIALFQKASPAVVHITTLTQVRDFFTLDLFQVPQGTGSGFVWDKKGHLVTNYHVIQGADAAHVTLADRSTWKARLVGAYPDKDLAVLAIGATPQRLHPIPLGTSHDLKVGQKVFAIGNPFGLDQTLTTGIISALGREIESPNHRPIRGVIQTDAAINPGNSGGPLLDSAGRLIGVNVAIFSPTGAWAGVGFAIPVDEVNRIVPQLIRYGKVRRPGLGIYLASDQQAREMGINQGVLILRVQRDSPAAAAGLRGLHRDEQGQFHLGDVILALDDKPIRSVNDLLDALEAHQAGDQVRLTILRKGEKQQVEVRLAEID
jgi:S1-C subfamily serine protease